MASYNNNFTSFTITQPFLGAPLQFTPALGSRELEQLIDVFVTGSASKQEKFSDITIDFYNNATVDITTGALVKTYHVYSSPNTSFASPQWTFGQSPTQSQSSGLSPTIYTPSPASSAANLGDSGYGSFSTASMTPPTRGVSASARVAKKVKKETKKAAEIRLPGFSIMTKDGVDVTNCAGRGTKTKEQREHAHLMRIMKACDVCKKKKVKCDPSHRRAHHEMSRTSTISTVATPASSSSHPSGKPNPSPPMISNHTTPSLSRGSTNAYMPTYGSAIDDFVLFPEDTSAWSANMNAHGSLPQDYDLSQFNFDISDSVDAVNVSSTTNSGLDFYSPSYDFSMEAYQSNRSQQPFTRQDYFNDHLSFDISDLGDASNVSATTNSGLEFYPPYDFSTEAYPSDGNQQPFSRQDHFRDHLRDHHKQEDVSALQDLVTSDQPQSQRNSNLQQAQWNDLDWISVPRSQQRTMRPGQDGLRTSSPSDVADGSLNSVAPNANLPAGRLPSDGFDRHANIIHGLSLLQNTINDIKSNVLGSNSSSEYIGDSRDIGDDLGEIGETIALVKSGNSSRNHKHNGGANGVREDINVLGSDSNGILQETTESDAISASHAGYSLVQQSSLDLSNNSRRPQVDSQQLLQPTLLSARMYNMYAIWCILSLLFSQLSGTSSWLVLGVVLLIAESLSSKPSPGSKNGKVINMMTSLASLASSLSLLISKPSKSYEPTKQTPKCTDKALSQYIYGNTSLMMRVGMSG